MKNTTIILLLFWSIQSIAQQLDFKPFATPILKLDSDTLFSNPDFVDRLIKDKRILLLGELDHGDGSSFELKTALIQYLHKKHGFKHLIFEAGLINSDALWNAVEQGKSAVQLAPKHLYYIWSQVEETQALFQYIDTAYAKGKPLKISGIDPQFSGTHNEKSFIDLLKSQLTQLEVEEKRFQELAYELSIMSKWLSYPKKREHQIKESTFFAHLDYYKKKILTQIKEEERTLWNLYFENVATFAKIKWERRAGSFERRDQQMFNNLKYYLEKYPNEKIIVWAANAHIIRNDHLLKGKDSDRDLIGLKKLGDHIFDAFPQETYAIALSTRRGSTLNFLKKRKTIKIDPPKNGSLEERLKALEFAFVDLKLMEATLELKEYESQLFYTNVRCLSRWSQHFDAVLFIEEMKPSTPLW